MKQFFKIFVLLLIPTLSFAQYEEYDWEERDKWMDTAYIFEKAGITPGSFVADIGCHEGYLSIHLANTVGEDGKVYAVDVREDRLETLRENLQKRDLKNVSVIHGDYDNPKLPKNLLDAVIIMDTYHEMTDYMTILEHVKTSLKPGGRIIIIEKQKNKIRDQSRKSQTNSHSMTPKYVKKELLSAGFEQLVQKSKMGYWESLCCL